MKKILVVKDMYNYVHINVVIGGKIPVGNFLTIIKLGNNVLQCIAHSHPVWKDERSMLGSDDGQ